MRGRILAGWLAAMAGPVTAGCGGGDDAAAADAATPDAYVEVWATYTIERGDHDATVTGGGEGNPLRGFVEVGGRDYRFAFDPSAAYVLTSPVDPEDQLDWNKLPGLSDCETIDLAVDGAMFGWRWRIDLDPPRLEVTAYANATGVHQTPAEPLFTLDAADLAADVPIRYRLWPDGDQFHFQVSGTAGGRTIAADTTLPRSCPATPPTSFRWAAGLYFGGTSTAPTRITGRVVEIPFAP